MGTNASVSSSESSSADAPNTGTGLPLEGLRILDLTRALSGPFCASLLGDLGADVIKVESLEGDMIRRWGPFKDDTSLYHLAVNRNKRSIAVDMRSFEGAELLKRLAVHADVLVENFRPGVLENLGLSKTWLDANASTLIVAGISGYGESGPLAHEPCFDQIAQGMGGLMSVTGTPVSGPLRSGVPMADMLSGTFAAVGICAALVGRERSGRASTVGTSLLESVMGILAFHAQRFLSLGEVPLLAGNDHPVISPYGVFDTADAPINLAAATDGQWRALCKVLAREDLAADPMYESQATRAHNKDALRKEIESVLISRTSATWIEDLRNARVPVGPINDIAQMFDEQQVKAIRMVEQVEHPDLGTVSILRGPLHFDAEPTHIRRTPPLLGEHSREICEEVGMSASEIDALFERRIISEPTSSKGGSK